MEKQDAPTQLFLGAEDVDYCVLTAMGAWLEINFFSNQKKTMNFISVSLAKTTPTQSRGNTLMLLGLLLILRTPVQ